MLGHVKRLLAVVVLVSAGACAGLSQTPDEPSLVFVAMLDLSGRGLLGGVSGLEVDAAGTTATAVRDDGLALEFPLEFDADGTLVGIGTVRAAPIGGVPLGAPKSLSDAEVLRREADGSWLVAFEGRHRVARHAPGWEGLLSEPVLLDLPPEVADLPVNKGIESVAVAPDGTIVIIAETTGPDGLNPAWIGRNGTWAARRYRTEPEFQPTDALFLPNGDLLVLERAFSILRGFRCRLSRVPAEEVASSEVWEGRFLGRVHPPEPASEDNFEGLALLPPDGDRIRLLAISDDNFSPLQRTLLLQFDLLPPAAPATGG
ncbi:MAG: esterase-like activity of phytase family protein [Alphaproteobacteria bacterium]